MKVIGIYPGHFQPPHKGHLAIHTKLQQIVGKEAFIAIVEETPTPEEPLNFGDIEQIWVRHGVPASHIVKTDDWKRPIEVLKRFSAAHTSLIIALDAKEVQKLSLRSQDQGGKRVWVTVDGQPKYVQPYEGNERSMVSLDKHAYVMAVEGNRIDGKPLTSKKVREMLGSPKFTQENKKKFFQWAFGWFDISLFQLLTDKFKNAFQVASPHSEQPEPEETEGEESETDEQPMSEAMMTNLVQTIVKELFGTSSEPSAPSMSSDTNEPLKPGEEQRAKIDAKASASDAKKNAERDLKTANADLAFKKSSVEKLRKDDIPNKRKEIDMYNKALSNPSIGM